MKFRRILTLQEKGRYFIFIVYFSEKHCFQHAQEKSFNNKIGQQKILQSTHAREENHGQGIQYAHIKLRHGKMK